MHSHKLPYQILRNQTSRWISNIDIDIVPIYSPCARSREAIMRNRVPIERQINRLLNDTLHDENNS